MEILTTTARIYPRECWITEEDSDTRFRTIPHSCETGNLQEAGELTLDSGASRVFRFKHRQFLFVLPVVGRHAVFCGGTYLGGYEPGQLLCLPVSDADTVRIGNLSGTVLSLCWCFCFDASDFGAAFPATAQFDPLLPLNRLTSMSFIPGTAQEQPEFGIGRYAGRYEDQNIRETPAAFFFVVIQGAAEVEGRLLHAGEALLLQDCSHAAWEALTNDTILILLQY